jgi:four helix bundle protein
MQKITNFTDLVTWQEGHALVLKIYELTGLFPKAEAYSLTDQMRRCAISITSNIAEGFSRRTSKDKTQFYYISLGSTTELQNQLMIARDLNYITKEKFDDLFQKTIFIHKLLFGLIKSSRALNP